MVYRIGCIEGPATRTHTFEATGLMPFLEIPWAEVKEKVAAPESSGTLLLAVCVWFSAVSVGNLAAFLGFHLSRAR